MRTDIAVIGAGAAGLMAAFAAAGADRRVLLLEKKPKPGLKILISGGGRCNLTTTRSGRDLEAQYGARRGRFLRAALRAFPPRALCQLIEDAGVPLREEDLEKVFPVSGKAADVQSALLRLVDAAGVDLWTEAPMIDLQRGPGGFEINTPRGVVHARAVIVATGGLSYPRTGTTGDGYAVCAALGHEIVRPVPALAPLAIDQQWVAALAGVTVDAVLTLRGPAGEVLCQRRRPTLFTHKGLSGPAPMDLAGFVEEAGGHCTLVMDFAPDQSRESLRDELLAAARDHGRRKVAQVLPEHLPVRLRHALAHRAAADVALAELTRPAREAVIDEVKSAALPVDRSLGFGHAEVTRGGVNLDEIDPRTMASRIVPGLYLCGEVIDIDGPIGGFNFQAAFATARLAGASAAGDGQSPSP